MPWFERDGVRIALNAKGYLTDFAAWNEEVARVLAADEQIDALTDDHWHVITFMRAYQQEHGTAPMIRVLCHRTGFSLQKIYDLFPGGPAKCACRVAGLPRPDSCV